MTIRKCIKCGGSARLRLIKNINLNKEYHYSCDQCGYEFTRHSVGSLIFLFVFGGVFTFGWGIKVISAIKDRLAGQPFEAFWEVIFTLVGIGILFSGIYDLFGRIKEKI